MIGVLLAFCGILSATNASTYKLDDASIDVVIANAEEISPDFATITDASNLLVATSSANATLSAKNPWAAWVICWFLGEFGIHRHYMGTSGSMWALYTFTCCGIFGIVPAVDWVVLLIGAIKDDIRKYENNTKFFMW